MNEEIYFFDDRKSPTDQEVNCNTKCATSISQSSQPLRNHLSTIWSFLKENLHFHRYKIQLTIAINH